ncbi:unnamed protein product [Peniophora sp. CBMAI 1063]|nr:unnamed protein product [Peniophora sp. CBMAI 1063]
MLAHSTNSPSGSAWQQKGCSVCSTRMSPTTYGPLPPVTDRNYAPRVGEIWCIEESIFSPVANLLGQTMPAIMASSVTSFSDDRASKPRPCLIYQQSSKNQGSYLVYLFGTFNGGHIEHLPHALQFFLAQVDPQFSKRHPKDFNRKRLPCMHASPSWKHHPQFVVALPHWTEPGFGKRRTLNHLDRIWTDCKDCAHTRDKKPWAKKDDCPTFQFCESQRMALSDLGVRKTQQWQRKSDAEMTLMTNAFRTALEAKIQARARDNESVRSFGSAGSDMASQYSGMTGFTMPGPSKLRDSIIAEESMVPAQEEAVPAISRQPSLSESSSGESESEPETPALLHAELPSPIIVGIERLTLDSESQPEFADAPTPKHKTFGRRPAVPRSPTGSTRSFPRSLLDRALRSTKNQAAPAKFAEEWPSLPTSPTTPTNGSWRHRRRDSRASKASTTRGI